MNNNGEIIFAEGNYDLAEGETCTWTITVDDNLVRTMLLCDYFIHNIVHWKNVKHLFTCKLMATM